MAQREAVAENPADRAPCSTRGLSQASPHGLGVESWGKAGAVGWTIESNMSRSRCTWTSTASSRPPAISPFDKGLKWQR